MKDTHKGMLGRGGRRAAMGEPSPKMPPSKKKKKGAKADLGALRHFRGY